MNRYRIWGGMAALMILVGGISAQNVKRVESEKTTKAAFDDATFVKKASSGGIHEVELGKLAMKNASGQDLMKFGEKMVADHGKAGKELKEIAAAEGFPVVEKQLPEHQSHFDMLKDLKGAEFDKAYVKHMVNDHEGDVAEFTKASKEAKSAKLKAFAEKTLPVIKGHLEMIKQIEAKINAGKGK